MHVHKRDWIEKLPEALWTYHTTWRNTRRHTPYELFYGKKVMFPIELKIKSFKTTIKLGLDLSESQRQIME